MLRRRAPALVFAWMREQITRCLSRTCPVIEDGTGEGLYGRRRISTRLSVLRRVRSSCRLRVPQKAGLWHASDDSRLHSNISVWNNG
ncbi:hypothetical protein P171DRAFT_264806 [Karstenula rhodostoma CBS 690.94]|uniref:Uncharacterized protein n=1 Tax=Karstenula rhodostoma CBS 690.94 TaxID=1392251 RepID=A0A9P4UDP5_9PLEO|nr:hypothetical protein P171DRAFT_264806 [Karstenula rhodostoma CBS 690.94]